MLFPDLSAPRGSVEQALPKKPKVAFVGDRFLALLLDFLIFSPVVSFFIAGLLRQTKMYFLFDTRSVEGYVAIFFMVGFSAALVTFLQSVFLFFWQATPGQKFMQMRVYSYPVVRAHLTYPQCLLRASLWTLSCLSLGIPFMEILSHPLRRAIHERASDTMVATLKAQGDGGPLAIEEKFISSWLRVSFIFAAFFATIFVLREYQELQLGRYKTPVDAKMYCSEMPAEELSGTQRLDAAVSLFLLNSISSECLRKEAEASLWSDPVNAQGMAYLAMYVVSDPTTQKDYLSKLCNMSAEKECTIVKYLAGEVRTLPVVDSKESWTEQVLKVEDLYTRRDFVGSLKQIEKLQKFGIFESALEKKFVRSIWALQSPTTGKGRVPASQSESQHWLEVFKGRYDVE